MTCGTKRSFVRSSRYDRSLPRAFPFRLAVFALLDDESGRLWRRACLPCGCEDRSRRGGRCLPARRIRPAAGTGTRIRCRTCRRNSGSARPCRCSRSRSRSPDKPESVYHFMPAVAPVLIPLRRAISGWQKNSISICSNSRERNVKFRGVISLRKLLPIWAMPKGTRTRVLSQTFLKLTKMPWAVSGRRKAASFFAAERADDRLEHQVEVARRGERAQRLGVRAEHLVVSEPGRFWPARRAGFARRRSAASLAGD